MDLISSTLNLSRLSNGELFQEMAFFAYLGDNSFGKESLQFITGAKIMHELYRRFTDKNKVIEALRADTIRKIADYTKKNPRASTDEQAREIKKHVDDFSVKVTLIKAGVF